MTSIFSLREAVKEFACFSQPLTYIVEDLYESERADYEEMLGGGKPREQLTVNDFGTIAWGPLAYLTPEAMAYLLPRLMELAESGEKDRLGDPFMMRLINCFSEGPAGPEFSLLKASHIAVVAAFLEHLSIEHSALVRQACWEDVLAKGIQNWRDA